MSHKEQILKSIEDEFKIIKHLHSKIPQGKEDFRPAENMRTVIELLRYLSWCGVATLKTFIDGDPDSPNFEIYREFSTPAKKLTSEDFNEAMDKQLDSIRKLFERFNDDDLLTKKVMMPYQYKVPLGEGIINTSLKHMTAYRMQLYMYLKVLGIELNTVNCWLGEDEDEE